VVEFSIGPTLCGIDTIPGDRLALQTTSLALGATCVLQFEVDQCVPVSWSTQRFDAATGERWRREWQSNQFIKTNIEMGYICMLW